MKVAIHYDPPSRRSSHVAAAMMEGVQRAGDQAIMVEHFKAADGADAGFAYGWGHPEMFEAYRAKGGSFVYADLGWWDRKPAGRIMDGFHKLVVGAREPTGYFRRARDGSRLRTLGVKVAPWRSNGSFILLAGMSAKSAKTRGFQPYEWELGAIKRIREHTDRPIVFRPKPSWAEAKPIQGCGFSGPAVPVEHALRDCWAVVTLHSNVAVDALCAGVPCVAEEGVASTLAGTFETLANPPLPDGREQLMADISFCQFSLNEMRNGLPWRLFKGEGLLCSNGLSEPGSASR